MVNTCVENTLVKRDKRLYNRMVKAMQNTQPGDFNEFRDSLFKSFDTLAYNLRRDINQVDEFHREKMLLFFKLNKRQRDFLFTRAFQKAGFTLDKVYLVNMFGSRLQRGSNDIYASVDIEGIVSARCGFYFVDSPKENRFSNLEWRIGYGREKGMISADTSIPFAPGKYIQTFAGAVRLWNALAVAKDKADSITEEEFIELARLADSF